MRLLNLYISGSDFVLISCYKGVNVTKIYMHVLIFIGCYNICHTFETGFIEVVLKIIDIT